MEYKDRQTNVNYEECLDYVRRSSNPSKLRITDVKFTKVDLPPWGCYLVRIDTNQGISGYGEMRDGASATYLKYLKSRIVGENPCVGGILVCPDLEHFLQDQDSSYRHTHVCGGVFC